jgi:hypothetical protein
VDLSDRRYGDVIRDFFNIRKEKGPDDQEYKTFSLFLNEFFKTKQIQNENDGFRAIWNDSEGKLQASRHALEKLNLIQEKAN